MIRKYESFVSKLNENYQQAKKWMLDNKKDPQKDRPFLELTQILKSKQGWMYPFLLFYYEEGISINDIKDLFQRLEKLHSKRMIADLPKDPSQYFKKDEGSVRTRFEELSDDVKFIEILATAIDFVNKRFTSALKSSYKQMLDRVKTERARFRNEGVIKNTLAEYIPLLEDKALIKDFQLIEKFNIQVQKITATENKMGKKFMEDNFYIKISKFSNFEDFSETIDAFFESIESGFSELLEKIGKFNGTKNDMYKIHLIYPEDPDDVITEKIGLFEYNTFQASKIMGSPNWCIVTSIGSWNTYVGAKGTYRRQYVIHNYNLPSTDPNRMIGITKNQDGSYHTAHNFTDAGVSEASLKSYCKHWKIPYKLMDNPVTAEQKEAKDLSFENTDLLVNLVKQCNDQKISDTDKKKLGKYADVTELTIDILNEFKDKYADFSAGSNALLIYCVELDSATDKDQHDYAMMMTEYVLKNGAFPENEKILEKSKTKEMIELLIERGANVSNSMILKFINEGNMDLLKYMFERTDFLIKRYSNGRIGELMREFKEKYSKSLRSNIKLYTMVNNQKNIQVINDLIKQYNL